MKKRKNDLTETHKKNHFDIHQIQEKTQVKIEQKTISTFIQHSEFAKMTKNCKNDQKTLFTTFFKIKKNHLFAWTKITKTEIDIY